MPGPGPIGISQSPDALPEPAGVLARMFPLVPGPDGAVRGDCATTADRAALAGAVPPEAAPGGATGAVCSLLEPSELAPAV
jgi:hypothetical protein